MQLANTLANIGCNNIIPTKIYIKIKLKASPIILTAKTKDSYNNVEKHKKNGCGCRLFYYLGGDKTHNIDALS